MKNNSNDQQEALNQVYNYAATLMVNEKKSANETKNALIEQGLDDNSASIVVSTLEKQLKENIKEKAKKDMLYGAMWCIGGLVATFSNFGFIFLGAIVFGAIQFLIGASKWDF